MDSIPPPERGRSASEACRVGVLGKAIPTRSPSATTLPFSRGGIRPALVGTIKSILRKALGVGVDHLFELRRIGIGEIAALADAIEQVGVLGAQQT